MDPVLGEIAEEVMAQCEYPSSEIPVGKVGVAAQASADESPGMERDDDAKTVAYDEDLVTSTSPEMEPSSGEPAIKRPLTDSPPPLARGHPASGDSETAATPPEGKKPRTYIIHESLNPKPAGSTSDAKSPTSTPSGDVAPSTPAAPAPPVTPASVQAVTPPRSFPPRLPISGRASPVGSRQSGSRRHLEDVERALLLPAPLRGLSLLTPPRASICPS